MPNSFHAIDVETANSDMASICQIGIISFEDGQIVSTWQSLINPEDHFEGMNVAIHGIDRRSVQDAPTFPQVSSKLVDLLSGQIVASHMPFDRVAMARVHDKYDLPILECTWLDTARVCRRAWSQFAQRGYGLANVASWAGIDFKHHDAEEDARAAGMILLRAVADTGITVSDWVTRSQRGISSLGGSSSSESVARTGNPDGSLAGEVVVFTGALTMARREAADLAASAGCDVGNSVGKKTTVVVVGDQDLEMLAGHEKSSKHRKAEQCIERGQTIRIIGERDFRSLIETDG
jgi:DNA polymerase-3 subunit epsilon